MVIGMYNSHYPQVNTMTRNMNEWFGTLLAVGVVFVDSGLRTFAKILVTQSEFNVSEINFIRYFTTFIVSVAYGLYLTFYKQNINGNYFKSIQFCVTKKIQKKKKQKKMERHTKV